MSVRSRLTPLLLVSEGRLVKSIRFSEHRYLGDPLNAMRIFNEKRVDELIVFDIGRSKHTSAPDMGFVGALASECEMPLCYGGGVTTVSQVVELVHLGVEKVSLNSAAIATPDLIRASAGEVGSQSVIVTIDAREANGEYFACCANGTVLLDRTVVEVAEEAAKLGAGEIVVNSVDRDGVMEGYDLVLAARVRSAVDTPLSFVGGAGNLDHVRDLIEAVGTCGAVAGSLFVYKGPLKAVLISYPPAAKRNALTSTPTG